MFGPYGILAFMKAFQRPVRSVFRPYDVGFL